MTRLPARAHNGRNGGTLSDLNCPKQGFAPPDLKTKVTPGIYRAPSSLEAPWTALRFIYYSRRCEEGGKKAGEKTELCGRDYGWDDTMGVRPPSDNCVRAGPLGPLPPPVKHGTGTKNHHHHHHQRFFPKDDTKRPIDTLVYKLHHMEGHSSTPSLSVSATLSDKTSSRDTAPVLFSRTMGRTLL